MCVCVYVCVCVCFVSLSECVSKRIPNLLKLCKDVWNPYKQAELTIHNAHLGIKGPLVLQSTSLAILGWTRSSPSTMYMCNHCTAVCFSSSRRVRQATRPNTIGMANNCVHTCRLRRLRIVVLQSTHRRCALRCWIVLRSVLSESCHKNTHCL